MDYMKLAFERAPEVVIGVVLTVFVVTSLITVLAKSFGFNIIGDRHKLVADERKIANVNDGVTDINTKLEGLEKRLSAVGEIEKRLGVVELDLKNRPTKEDHHRLELSFTRLEGEVKSSFMTIQASAAAISRIEDFMYAAAARQRQGGSA